MYKKLLHVIERTGLGAVVLGIGWNSKSGCWCRLTNIVVPFDGKKLLMYCGQRAHPGPKPKGGAV